MGSQNIIIESSSDYCKTWSQYHEITALPLRIISERSFDIIQKDNNNFLIAYLQFPGKLAIFNYNIASTSLEQVGTAFTLSSGVQEIEFTFIDESTYLASLKDTGDNVFYTRSDDGALTWSTNHSFAGVLTGNRPIITSYHNGNLYAAIAEENKISLIVSPDKGVTWSAPFDVFLNDKPISNTSIHSDGEKLFVVFEEHIFVNQLDNYQTDVCYISSNNNGVDWSGKIKYTKYIRNDLISSIKLSGDRIIALVLSNRVNQERQDTYLGILAETIDPAPPAINWMDFPNPIDFDQDFQIQVFAYDETGINSVSVEFNHKVYTLYDDGNHEDFLAGDYIYGGTIDGVPTNTSLGPDKSKIIGLNNVQLPISNNGVIADISTAEKIRLAVKVIDTDQNEINRTANVYMGELSGRDGKYDGLNILFSGGFFLSGYSNNSLWFNAVSSSSLMVDYQAGNIGVNPTDPDNLIYSVLSGDTPFGHSWQDWKKAVDNGAYFYDGDNDGVYNPVDKNENGVWDPDEDKPDLLYDGVYFTSYNDGVPASERRFDTIEPKGIEIRQSIYASNRNSILDDVIFFRYSLLYKGLGNADEPDSLTDVYFSVWTDSDIGSADDDKAGCDTTLHSGYTYNNGSDQVFGENPPAFFKTIVQGPLVKTGNSADYGYNKFGPDIGINALQGYKNLGMTTFAPPHKNHYKLLDPRNPLEGRRYQEALYPFDGSEIDPCTFEFGEVRGGVNCVEVNNKFWFSGDPVTNYGWIGTFALDMRDLTTTGAFTLHKNEPMDIIVAYVVGRGIDYLNSIDRAREITQYVHEEYQRNFSTIVSVEDNNEELPAKFYLSQNYPNPFNPATKIKYTIGVVDENFRPLQTQLIVYDILGRKVKTLVNEVKAPGTYEITFDASQLASGVYLFRLSSGSFSQTKKMMVLK
ncbi:hypothetical protein ASZ90_005062 [hydrocarbon metagenome]|uniref:Secretion system C-terminal sorting domain-containing protein n=1 Tax=hydrocarbon metagenome TaxID=938273 RepID=A0A0W8FWM6_9ZZZZ